MKSPLLISNGRPVTVGVAWMISTISLMSCQSRDGRRNRQSVFALDQHDASLWSPSLPGNQSLRLPASKEEPRRLTAKTVVRHRMCAPDTCASPRENPGLFTKAAPRREAVE
jgi:hypothetical protein